MMVWSRNMDTNHNLCGESVLKLSSTFLSGLAGLVLYYCTTAQVVATPRDDDFVLNNIIHIMYHEAGHALIDQFELPVIGQEEDAADAFATINVIDAFENFDLVLSDTAMAMIALQDLNNSEDLDFFSEHDLDIQRGMRIICFGVGAEPEKFENIAASFEMTREQIENCADRFDQSMLGWHDLLKSSYRKEEAPRADLRISYAPSGTYKTERALLLNSAVLEDFGADLVDQFAFGSELKIIARECGEANAFYEPATGSISICYEMMTLLRGLDTGLKDE